MSLQSLIVGIPLGLLIWGVLVLVIIVIWQGVQ
jgi:hypothetical protein